MGIPSLLRPGPPGAGRPAGQARIGQGGAEEQLVARGQVEAVLAAVKPQGAAAFAGAVQQVLPLVGRQFIGCFSVPQAADGVQPVYRGKTTQQHGGGLALRLGDEVQAAVHAVDEIDVGMARRAEHGGVAGGLVVAVGVGGLVDGAHIGLRFRDAAHQQLALIPPHQIAADEAAGDIHRISRIKIPTKYCHFRPPVVC